MGVRTADEARALLARELDINTGQLEVKAIPGASGCFAAEWKMGGHVTLLIVLENTGYAAVYPTGERERYKEHVKRLQPSEQQQSRR
jgi:hypothetical protein